MGNKVPAAAIGMHSSLKRIAWAYGCAKRGSPEEDDLCELLVAKVSSFVPDDPEGEPEPYSDEWYRRQVDGHPTTAACPDDECCVCAWRDCPHREPMHYHHDGCPCCNDDLPTEQVF